MSAATADRGAIRGDRAFFGHPRGLGTLAFTEGWIGFSYYGMQSLLVLYMVGTLLTPGHVDHVFGMGPFRALLQHVYGPLSGQALAAAIMGLYSALIWAAPIGGGLLADRVLGRTPTIVLGAALMTAGHFLMAFDASFLLALSCIIAGAGCAGSIKAQVGGLYGPGDTRRADAFQVYTLSVQFAVIIAPLVCGTLGERYAWHWGFAAAGTGMLIGLLVYLAGQRHLPPEPMVRRGGHHVAAPRLSGPEWRALAALAALLPVLGLVALGNMEIFNGYMIWGKANFDLVFFGRTMPVSWLLSLDAIVSVGTLLGSVLFWRWRARRHREPDEIAKMTIGAALCACAPLVLAAASMHAAGGHKVGLGWGVAFHVVNGVGFANVYAVGLALFSRASPLSLGATVVNGYSLHLFLSNLLVGYLAGLLSVMPAVTFWLLHAALIAAAAAVLLLFGPVFRRVLAPASCARPAAG